MDEDSIRILHIHSPHLIWIEVRKDDTFSLRQVGLFGVVPRQASVVDGERVCTKSDRWDPRANEIIEEFLEAKHHLYFKATYRLDDENTPTSIFKNQSHIFGDIYTFKKHDGVRKQLVNCLDNSVYAFKSMPEFWQMLSNGKIKTQLDEEEAIEVLQKIIKNYENKGTWDKKKEVFFQHLSLHQREKLIESTPPKLTAENLVKHQMLTSNQTTIKKETLKNVHTKMKNRIYQDFNYTGVNTVEFVENIIKNRMVVDTSDKTINKNVEKNIHNDSLTKHKPDLEETGSNYQEDQAFMKISCEIGSTVSRITVYDEEISPQDGRDDISNNAESTPEKAIGCAYSRKKHERSSPDVSTKFENLLKLKEKLKKHNMSQNSSMTEDFGLQNVSNDLKEYTPKDSYDKNITERTTYSESREQRNKLHNQSLNSGTSSKASSTAKYTEVLVAYGPPTSSLQHLVRKRVVVKIEDPSTKLNEDIDSWKIGKICWEDEETADDLKVETRPNNTTFVHKDNVDVDSKNCRKKAQCYDQGSDEIVSDRYKGGKDIVRKTDCDENFDTSVPIGRDLNEPKAYNDLIQSKQVHKVDLKSLKCENDVQNVAFKISSNDAQRSDDSAVKNNNQQLLNANLKITKSDNNDNTVHKKNKLLELMRRRKIEQKHNEVLSSTDDSTVQNANNIISFHKVSRHLHPQLDKHNGNNDKTDSSRIQPNDTKSDTDDELEQTIAKLDLTQTHKENETHGKVNKQLTELHVNPYKNLDIGKSVFVENLVQPLLLAHTKNSNKVLPRSDLRDIPFKISIQNVLRNKQVTSPSRLQSVSWPYILRGHSIFMISALGTGKTLGYLPSVCNLVLDYNFGFPGLGPTCLIVCATAASVACVARECKMFVDHQKVLTCFPGMEYKTIITELVNGCDILVVTPSLLCRLLGVEIGVDLRRLTTLVFEDCERLENVYDTEIKAIQLYVKKMLKTRIDKQVKVQFILASRKWCDFMYPLAKKAPDTIVTFAAFHECVLYSKADTSVSFLKKNKKIDAVIEFLKEVDNSKLTVIVCRSDDEVTLLESTLTALKHTVVACNNQMNIHDLYKLRTEELSSVFICCDGNLNHLNITYANYLVHFSMPAVYSLFCKRFVVLNDNYPSIFGAPNKNIKIKILLEETNVEQLPKILNFVKRCSSQVPEVLNEIAVKVLEQKDLSKAEKLVPICDNLLSLGECGDLYTCQNRHAVLEHFDEPKPWVPSHGVITFKIIHYNSAISYSARLLTHSSSIEKKKFPETYGTLCMRLALFFTKECNKRLHCEPKVGDICAVAITKNQIARCQVLKVDDFEKGYATHVVINLIDEEQITVVRAVELYFLPDEYKAVETHVVKVRLAGIRPQDKDLTFSELAMNKLKKITDGDEQLYLRGRVVMAAGNSVFVDTLEACADLTALLETVVKFDFKKLLLETHAVANEDHLLKLEKLCDAGNFKLRREPTKVNKVQTTERATEHRWAHLDRNDWSQVLCTNIINAGKFLVRLENFNKCVDSLIKDINKYVLDNPKPVDNVKVNDIVLAEFPDDSVYERAIVEEIIDDSKVTCFFVDNSDWRDVAVDKLKPIPDKFIKQLPFQSIECRLIGVKPPGKTWTEFSSNWFNDCLEDQDGNPKTMCAKYFTKEKADITGGNKYAVLIVDTTTEDDLILNKRMVDLNLAAVEENEIEYLEKPIDFVRNKSDNSSIEDDLDNQDVDTKHNKQKRSKYSIPIPIETASKDDESDWEVTNTKNGNEIVTYTSKDEGVPVKSFFAEKPLRSFPLVNDSDEDSDKWDVCMNEDLSKCFGLPKLKNTDFTNEKEPCLSKPEHKIMSDIPNVEHESEYHTIKHTVVSNRDVDQDNDTDKPHVNKDNGAHKVTVENIKAIVEKEHEDFECYRKDFGIENHVVDDTRSVQDEKNDKVIDTSGLELGENAILKGEIKDVSFYDSDDTISTSGIHLIETSSNKLIKQASLLDSDDTRSILTENSKELIDETSKTSITLDSDDSETENTKKNKEKTITDTNTDEHENIIVTNDSTREKVTSKLKTVTITEIANVLSENITEKLKSDKEDGISENVNKIDGHLAKEHDNIKESTNVVNKTITVTESEQPVRTPQLLWKQNKNVITIKIKLVVDDYTLQSEIRSLKFSAYQNEVKYGFEIELYGLIDESKTKHANKGQYILVTLVVLLKKYTRWLKLTKDSIKHWIVYDVESLDTSSDEETPCNADALKIIMKQHEQSYNCDDYGDDLDDSVIRYKDEY